MIKRVLFVPNIFQPLLQCTSICFYSLKQSPRILVSLTTAIAVHLGVCSSARNDSYDVLKGPHPECLRVCLTLFPRYVLLSKGNRSRTQERPRPEAERLCFMYPSKTRGEDEAEYAENRVRAEFTSWYAELRSLRLDYAAEGREGDNVVSVVRVLYERDRLGRHKRRSRDVMWAGCDVRDVHRESVSRTFSAASRRARCLKLEIVIRCM